MANRTENTYPAVEYPPDFEYVHMNAEFYMGRKLPYYLESSEKACAGPVSSKLAGDACSSLLCFLQCGSRNQSFLQSLVSARSSSLCSCMSQDVLCRWEVKEGQGNCTQQAPQASHCQEVPACNNSS